MTGIPTAEEIEAAKAALQVNVESEARKQPSSTAGDALGGAAEIAGNVMVEGVGEVIGAVVGTVAEGVGTVAAATGEVVVSVIGGLLDG